MDMDEYRQLKMKCNELINEKDLYVENMHELKMSNLDLLQELEKLRQ